MQDEALIQAHDHIRATTVNGTDVFNPDAAHIGHIDDIVLSKRSGHAVYAILSFGGFLRLGERYHPLPWASLHYDENLAGYVVNVTREQLEGAPSYQRGDDPDWNDPDFDKRIAGYYGFPYL